MIINHSRYRQPHVVAINDMLEKRVNESFQPAVREAGFVPKSLEKYMGDITAAAQKDAEAGEFRASMARGKDLQKIKSAYVAEAAPDRKAALKTARKALNKAQLGKQKEAKSYDLLEILLNLHKKAEQGREPASVTVKSKAGERILSLDSYGNATAIQTKGEAQNNRRFTEAYDKAYEKAMAKLEASGALAGEEAAGEGPQADAPGIDILV